MPDFVSGRRIGQVVGVLCVLLAACSGGGEDEPAERDEPTESTTTSQPPASAEAEVRPYIEDLLATWDAGMTDIVEDPRLVADDPEHELAAELAASFTDDSPFMRDLSVLMDSYATQDTGIHPGPSGLAQRTTLLHFTQAPDDDHVSFVFCSYQDGVQYRLSDGVDRQASIGIVTGAGDATRVEGEWRLHRLRQLGLEWESAGTPDPCPDLVEAEDTAP